MREVIEKPKEAGREHFEERGIIDRTAERAS